MSAFQCFNVFIFQSGIQPFYGFISDDAGDVAAVCRLGAVLMDEHRVVVVTLCRQNLPMVEARGGADEVPFTDEGGLVAGSLQELGHRLL